MSPSFARWRCGVPDTSLIQACLDDLRSGDGAAWERLVPLVYEPLRRQARAVFGGRLTLLQATDLLHEALLDIQVDLAQFQFESPPRFFALVSQVMRNRLSDHLRRGAAVKRGAGRPPVRLDSFGAELPEKLRTLDLLELADVLSRLHQLDEGLWALAELKLFVGLRNREIAAALGRGLSTVENDWTFVKAWLQQQLGNP